MSTGERERVVIAWFVRVCNFQLVPNRGPTAVCSPLFYPICFYQLPEIMVCIVIMVLMGNADTYAASLAEQAGVKCWTTSDADARASTWGDEDTEEIDEKDTATPNANEEKSPAAAEMVTLSIQQGDGAPPAEV